MRGAETTARSSDGKLFLQVKHRQQCGIGKPREADAQPGAHARGSGLLAAVRWASSGASSGGSVVSSKRISRAPPGASTAMEYWVASATPAAGMDWAADFASA